MLRAMTDAADTPVADRPRTRLFVAGPLDAGVRIELDGGRAHHLRNVLRMAPGDAVAVFDGAGGEWRAEVADLGKRGGALTVSARLRAQEAGPDLWLLAAPIRRDRYEAVAEKATELGVARIVPVLTARTQGGRVNTDRLRAVAVEAAEQCERLDVPEVAEPVRLADLLRAWPAGRVLAACAEAGPVRPVAEAAASVPPGTPAAVLVGPEGGFTQSELDALRGSPFCLPVGLGPRVLRADTAAVAALACWQALAEGGPAGGADRRPPARA